MNGEVTVQIAGVIRFPSPVFGSHRGPILVGTGGAFATVIPPAAAFVQQAGVVISATELHLNLDSTIIQL